LRPPSPPDSPFLLRRGQPPFLSAANLLRRMCPPDIDTRTLSQMRPQPAFLLGSAHRLPPPSHAGGPLSSRRRLSSAYPHRRGDTPPPNIEACLGEHLFEICTKHWCLRLQIHLA
jgi:hypothetical protein